MSVVPLSPVTTEPWLTKAQLAQVLGFSERWIEQRVNEGMPRHKWGGRVRFRRSDVEHWLDERDSR
jgi:excisionase family DNA binding protein